MQSMALAKDMLFPIWKNEYVITLHANFQAFLGQTSLINSLSLFLSLLSSPRDLIVVRCGALVGISSRPQASLLHPQNPEELGALQEQMMLWRHQQVPGDPAQRKIRHPPARLFVKLFHICFNNSKQHQQSRRTNYICGFGGGGERVWVNRKTHPHTKR